MNNKLHFKALGVCCALLLAGAGLHAQQPETSIYINGTLPMREFNNSVNFDRSTTTLGEFTPMDRDNIATGASAGLAATVRWGVWFELGFGQLLPYGEASFMWNASSRAVCDEYDNNKRNNELQEIPTPPTYFNVPLLIGIKYRYDLTPIVRPFAEMGIGYDLLFITPNGYHDNKPWYSYKPNGQLCWNIGAGTYLGEFVSVGVYYMGLGRHKIDYTNRCKASLGDESNNYNPEKRSLGQLGIRIGFHF